MSLDIKVLIVRNYCLMNEIYNMYAPDWAKHNVSNPEGFTEIHIPEDIIVDQEYDEFNMFAFGNVPTYKDHLYSNVQFVFKVGGKEIGFAIPVDGIIEGIGFLPPEKR